MDILPPVVTAGTDVGVLPVPWFDIPKGTNEHLLSNLEYSILSIINILKLQYKIYKI